MPSTSPRPAVTPSIETAALVAVSDGDLSDDQATRRDAQAQVRAERAALRAAARAIPPERDERYAHLSLREMRVHRHDLAEAEERIGYWQRIAQHRLDAARGTGTDLDVRRMNPELAMKGLDHARTKLIHTSRRPLPVLPSLLPLWGSDQDPGAADKIEKAMEELAVYQAALAAIAKAATTELIARYRQTPSDCLAILPA